MPNGWRTIESLVHKIRLHGRRGKGMAESFSREKLRHAPQKEGGWEILCDLPPVWPRLVRPTNLMSRTNRKKTHNTHTHCTYPTGRYEVTFSMSCRNAGSSCLHYRERHRSLPPHRLRCALRSGRWWHWPYVNVITSFIPYYLDKKYRREDTPVYFVSCIRTNDDGWQ